MEDFKSYIESGVLELYVLGDVTPAEKAEVEGMASKHPAIKAELNEIERSMELFAESNGIDPEEGLRGRVLNSIVTNLGDDRNFTAAPSHESVTAAPYDTEDNVVSFIQPKAVNYYKYAFAALVVLLIASGILLSSLYNKLQNSNSQLTALQTDRQHFANQVNLMDKQLAIFRDGSFKFLKLQGTPKHSEAAMTVAWSPVKKKVMIDMGTVKMPENDKAHQYQLWALVGGKPVSLGVFNKSPDSTDMKEMASIGAADAFAVTLEPRGGSTSPTMDQMMVIGKF